MKETRSTRNTRTIRGKYLPLCDAPNCQHPIDLDHAIGFEFTEAVPVDGFPGAKQGDRLQGIRYFCVTHQDEAIRAVRPLMARGIKRIFSISDQSGH